MQPRESYRREYHINRKGERVIKEEMLSRKKNILDNLETYLLVLDSRFFKSRLSRYRSLFFSILKLSIRIQEFLNRLVIDWWD